MSNDDEEMSKEDLTYRIGRSPGHQGPRSLLCNQGRDEKLATGRQNLKTLDERIKLRKPIKIGTWNIRSIKRIGKTKLLGNELERIGVDICGLAETKNTQSGDYSTVDGHVIIMSGKEGKHHHGVGMWINKKYVKTLVEYEPVDERILVVHLKASPVDLILIQCYAPTSAATDDELQQFYETLQTMQQKWKNKGMVMILGDMNAKVGEKDDGETTGKFGLGKRNEAGQNLVDFCCTNDLIITNTTFLQHKRRRYTWTSPDCVTRNQIDYIMIQKKWERSITKCKTYPGADLDTDHQLLAATVKIKLFNIKKKRNKRIDITSIINDRSEEYSCKITNRFQCLAEGDGIEEQWNQLKSNILEVAQEMAEEGRQGTTRKVNWISNDTLRLVDAKREARIHNPSEYAKLKREVQRSVRKDKEEHINQMCAEIEEESKQGNTRKLFKNVKNLTKKFTPRLNVIKDENGELLTNPECVVKRWKGYCEDMYRDDTAVNDILVHEREPPPLRSEVARAMSRIANNKAPGPDEVPAELFKLGGDSVLDRMHKLILEIWENGEWPEDWTETSFIPIPKKGDLTQCNNYRTIALVSHASKIILRIILDRIQTKTESELAQEQAGFRPRRGTRDQITNLNIVLNKAREYQKPLYLCFVDFQKAFDSIVHNKLWLAMLDMGYPAHLVQLLSSLYKKQKARVKMTQAVSEWFRVSKGVRQGCVLSPYLFNIVAEMAMRKALDGFKGGFCIGGRRISNLRYADDIVLIANSEEELQDLVNRLVEAGGDYGLKLNAGKTKVMHTNNEPINVIVEGNRLEQVNEITYLGFHISSDGECQTELNIRLVVALTAVTKLTTIWKNRGISKSTKFRLLKALVWPIATYGCEAWTLRKKEEEKIKAFETKCYRRILRVPWTAKKTNEEILGELGIQRQLLGMVMHRKLQYFGHIARQENSLEKDLMMGMVDGSRRRGRPRTSWMDNVSKWMGLTVPEAYRKAKNRSQWSRLVVTAAQHRNDETGE